MHAINGIRIGVGEVYPVHFKVIHKAYCILAPFAPELPSHLNGIMATYCPKVRA